jgi:diguanylate cyclase (GGDEF)-like protein
MQPDLTTRRLLDLVLGTDPRMRRMMRYWAATGLIYLIAIWLLTRVADTDHITARWSALVQWFCVGGVSLFFVLTRFSARLGIAPAHLALLQAAFAMACEIGAYVVVGSLRGASLVILPVVIVFCIFTLRPRAIMALCAGTIATLGAAMHTMVRIDPQGFPAALEWNHFALVTSALVSVTVLTGEMGKLRARLKQQKEELATAVGTIRTLATIDELTSLANRRYMNEVLNAEERRRVGAEQPICIALLDLDFFKRVNDQFGHDGGDSVLRAFAAAARAELRAADVLARWGGEEFLLLLPDTDLAHANGVLARMAERVRATRLPDLSAELEITFSGGVAERRTGEPFCDTISRADKAMYVAKSSGRDTVVAG